MSPDTSSMLACSYGSTILSLVDFEVTEVPHVKDQIGRVWTDVTVKAQLELTETDPEIFAANVALACVQLGGDGVNFIVTVGGETVYQFLAAQCLNGGPHAAFEMKNLGLLRMGWTMTLTAQRFDPATGPTNSFKIRTVTRADGLHSYVQSGEVIGPNAATYYLGTALPAAQKAWPLPGYSLEHEYEASTDANLSKVSYSITAVQYFGALPQIGNNVGAVSGEITLSIETDEQHRRTTTTSYDLLCAGQSPQQLVQQLRTQALTPPAGAAAGSPAPLMYRESGKSTTLKEQRISGSFVVLSSADKSPLLEWTETVSIKTSDSWEVKTYPGAAPVVVRRPQGLPTIRQTGSATAIGKFKMPTAIFASHLADPDVTLTDENDVVKKTTWSYEMYPSGAANAPNANYGLGDFDPGVMARSAQDNGYFKSATAQDTSADA